MNLLMMAPLLDSRGNLRYFIGAQIDVSGLVKDSTDLDAFQHMLNQQEGLEEQDEPKDEFQELSEMFNHSELDTVRKYGGNMHREHLQDGDDASMQHKPRLLIQDQSTYDEDKPQGPAPKPDGRLSGPYKHVSRDIRIISTEMYTNNLEVSYRAASTFSPDLVYIALTTRPRNLAVTVPRPYRWQHAGPRLPQSSAQ